MTEEEKQELKEFAKIIDTPEERETIKQFCKEWRALAEKRAKQRKAKIKKPKKEDFNSIDEYIDAKIEYDKTLEYIDWEELGQLPDWEYIPNFIDETTNEKFAGKYRYAQIPGETPEEMEERFFRIEKLDPSKVKMDIPTQRHKNPKNRVTEDM